MRFIKWILLISIISGVAMFVSCSEADMSDIFNIMDRDPIVVENAKFFVVTDAKVKNEEELGGHGVLKPGEYAITVRDGEQYGGILVNSGGASAGNKINLEYGERRYIIVENGDNFAASKVCITNAKYVEPQEISADEPMRTMLKVGHDIEPGGYRIMPGKDNKYGGTYNVFTKSDLVDQDVYFDSSESYIGSEAGMEYVQLDEDEYISLEDLVITNADEGMFIPEDGKYMEGVYRIGTDIPAGMYTITLVTNPLIPDMKIWSVKEFSDLDDEDGSVTNKVTNMTSLESDGENVIGHFDDNLTDSTITLFDGNYVSISGCCLTKR